MGTPRVRIAAGLVLLVVGVVVVVDRASAPAPTGSTGPLELVDVPTPTADRGAEDGPGRSEAELVELQDPAGVDDGSTFLETFDGEPDAPAPWNPVNWDVTVHSRDPATWSSLDPVDAAHGPGCEAPPATHLVTEYAGAVYTCRNHMMTALRGDAYGVVYLTPSRLVDFSESEAVISFDVSTLRTSARDWWDVWITPYDDALQLPLDLDASADLTGPPRNALRVGLVSENQLQAEIYENFENVSFPELAPRGRHRRHLHRI